MPVAKTSAPAGKVSQKQQPEESEEEEGSEDENLDLSEEEPAEEEIIKSPPKPAVKARGRQAKKN